MNKYYHRGNGEVVMPEIEQPDIHRPGSYSESVHQWNTHLASLPVTHYCDPSLPVGWLPECEERYEVRSRRFPNEWVVVTELSYNLRANNSRRIFLVPTTSKEEPKGEDEQDALWDEVEDIFDKHTAPTGGGYEADYTDRSAFLSELKSKYRIHKL